MGQKTVKKRQSYGFESSPNIILTIHLQLILEEKRMIPKEEAHVPRKRSREPTVLKTACGQWKRGWYQAQREENSPDTWEKEQDAEGHSEWGLVKKRKKEQTQAQGTFLKLVLFCLTTQALQDQFFQLRAATEEDICREITENMKQRPHRTLLTPVLGESQAKGPVAAVRSSLCIWNFNVQITRDPVKCRFVFRESGMEFEILNF